MGPSLERFSLLCFMSLVLLVAWSPPAFATWPNDPTVNVPVVTTASSQQAPVSCSDGAGGVIVAWVDGVGGMFPVTDIYAQRISADGVPLWGANGVPVCLATNNQQSATICTDGAGGAFISWTDDRAGAGTSDIYVQRLDGSGAPLWTVDGVALCTATGVQYVPKIASDGSAIVVWQDYRAGNGDIYSRPIGPTGIPSGTPDGQPVCNDPAEQSEPAVSVIYAHALITWTDSRGANAPNIYVQSLRTFVTPQLAINGAALCTAVGAQQRPVITTIQTGGSSDAIVVWEDFRAGGTGDIYARRFNTFGGPQWVLDGVALCVAANGQFNLQVVSDGSGGAIAVWEDARTVNTDIYSQRINGAGAVQWAPDGSAVCTAASFQYTPVLVVQSGGVIIGWSDQRNGALDIYAQKLTLGGVPVWTSDGVVLSSANGIQHSPTIVGDGAGGAILAWYDGRTGGNPDIYCQRVNVDGLIGEPEPSMESVADVPGDQGGKALVLWNASYLDAAPDYRIDEYTLWRRVITTAAMQALERGDAVVVGEGMRPASATGRRVFRVAPNATSAEFWEFIVTVPARGVSGYGYMVTTTSDSMSGSIPYNVFFVDAHDVIASKFYASEVDSGYSVDNLPPLPPQPFTGQAVSGATELEWGANGEDDFGVYRLYRGSSAGFVPGPGNLVIEKPDPDHIDAGHVGFYYKLSAVDVHGNESTFALLTPSGTLGAPGAVVGSLGIAVRPNPIVGEGSVWFEIPRAQEVTITAHDLAGRVAVTLVRGVVPPGEHTVRWTGRGEAGEVLPPGVYLLRIAAKESGVRVARMAVVR